MKHYWNVLVDAVKHRWKTLLVAVVLALLMQGVEYSGWIAGTEGRVLDLFLKLDSSLARKKDATVAPVILIEIDDAAYASCFGGTPPLDARLLQKIVQSLVDPPPGSSPGVGASVLGVDVITDSKLQNNVAAYADLRKLGKPPTHIVWAAGADVSITQGSSFWGWFWGTEDEVLAQPTGVLGIEGLKLRQQAIGPSPSDPWEWGLPVLPPDEDRRLRRFPRKITAIFANNGGSDPLTGATWASKIASFGTPRIAKDVDEVLLSYSIPGVAHYPLLALYSCEKNKDGTRNITTREDGFKNLKEDVYGPPNAIFLLGGTFASSGDFHDTSQGRISGLEINARAVQAELTGKGISEFPRWLMLFLDTAIGFAIGLIFLLRGWRIKVLMRWSLVVVLAVVVLSFVTLSLGYVWLSCIGVALGVVLHVIYEVYKMDLRVPEESGAKN
jgi:CHASE2 domain